MRNGLLGRNKGQYCTISLACCKAVKVKDDFDGFQARLPDNILFDSGIKSF